jgi:NAD(P)-dependent dehydrogenase (short-subunit alcohol dehydrogenase family)
VQGRVVLVTGASSGIGWTTVQVFARRGARVMAVARRGDRLAQLAAETGVETLAVSLSDEDGCRRAVSETEARLGSVDLLVTCAAIGSSAETVVWEEPTEVWAETMRSNLDAPFHLTGWRRRGWLSGASAGSSTRARRPASSAAPGCRRTARRSTA